ncbi:MAG: hypothetical protein ACJAR1_000827 [Rubritalea sp.]|jgi:hypothetical protein
MLPITKPSIWALSMLILSLTFSSCVWMKSVDKRVKESRDSVENKYLQEVRNHNKGVNNTLSINWNQGLEKMYLSNPSLIQADFRLADAKQRQKQVWTRMIPGLSVGLSDSFTLEDFGDAFSGSRFRINSFISLGNLIDLPQTIYTNKLTYLGSELQAENTMRQQVIALYRLFQEQRLHRIEKQALGLEFSLLESVSEVDNETYLTMKLKHEEAYETWENNIKTWETKVGDFFMDGYDTIHLDPKQIPDILYKPSELDFTDTSRWGLLQLNLLALESIAEDGRVLDAYLRYLPRANLSVTAPSIYSNSSNQSFDPALTRFGPSFNWNLDSQGYISQQLDRIKRESPLKEWRKDKRTREEVAKLMEGKEALIEVQQELVTLKSAMDVYKKAVRAGLIKDPESAVQMMRRLKEREVRFLAKEIEICSAFWLIDEQRWKPITKRWLETRKTRTEIREKNTKSNELRVKSQFKKWFGKSENQ